MKIANFIAGHWDGKQYVADAVESFDYSGPMALCDRGAQGMAKQDRTNDMSTASTLGGRAAGDYSAIDPYYRRNLDNPQGFSQRDTTQMLNYAEAGAGGANAGIAGEGALHNARTRNTSGYTAALDSAARTRGKTLAGVSEGIGAQDAMLKEQRRDEAAKGLTGLYGANTGGMLHAMGLENDATKNYMEAGKSGWFQNMTDFMRALGSMAGGMKGGKGLGGN